MPFVQSIPPSKALALATTDLFPASIVLPFPEGRIHGIFCVCHLSLGLTDLKFSPIAVCISSLFLFIAKKHSNVWINQIVFIL